MSALPFKLATKAIECFSMELRLVCLPFSSPKLVRLAEITVSFEMTVMRGGLFLFSSTDDWELGIS